VIRFRVDGVLREVLQTKRAVAPLSSRASRSCRARHRRESACRRTAASRCASRAAPSTCASRRSPRSRRARRAALCSTSRRAASISIARHGLVTQRHVDELIHKPNGILLVTGPTGSGKTTTLYAALERINDRTRNIMTVEDPIEYYIDGIGQTQVNTRSR
jgi:general secretion pathway protein E